MPSTLATTSGVPAAAACGELAVLELRDAVEREPRGQAVADRGMEPRRSPARRRRRWTRPGRSAARLPLGAASIPGASTPPSTSSASRSGACSSSACLIASSSVAEEAGQPSQLPERRIRALPSSIPTARRCRRATPCTGGRSRAPPAPAPRGRPGRGRGSASGWPRRRRRRAGRAARPSPRPPRRGRRRSSAAPRRRGRGRRRSAPRRCGERADRRSARGSPSAPGSARSALRVEPSRCSPSALLRLSTSPSGCASPCGPCRRRCTCARRTAGTDRSSAPPA